MRIIIFIITILSISFTQWPTSPEDPLWIGTGIQPQIQSTSDGGAYIAWLSDGDYNVHLQYLNPEGIPQWPAGGVQITNQPNSSWIAFYHMNMVVDLDNNAIITTVDTRSGLWQVYAYKLNTLAEHLWSINGIHLSITGTENISPRLCLDPTLQGVVVTWASDYSIIHIQGIDAEGSLSWGPNGGVTIFDPTGSYMSPQPVVAGGHVYIQWIRQTGGWPPISELLIQKMDGDGEFFWDSPTVVAGPVSFPMGNFQQKFLTGPEGNVFSGWTEMTTMNQTSKVQHVLDDGSVDWTNAAELSTVSDHFRTNAQIAVGPDSGEISAVWTETNSGQTNHGIYAQRLDADGNRLWGNGGIPIVPLSNQHDFLDLNGVGVDEDIVAVYIQDGFMIYAARIDSNGEFSWDETISTVCSTGFGKTDLIISKGAGSILNSWSSMGDIYAASLRADGTLGSPIIDEGCEPDGDVNMDLDLNVLDIVLVINFIVGTVTPTEDQWCIADVNTDGEVNILDIVTIVNLIIG